MPLLAWSKQNYSPVVELLYNLSDSGMVNTAIHRYTIQKRRRDEWTLLSFFGVTMKISLYSQIPCQMANCIACSMPVIKFIVIASWCCINEKKEEYFIKKKRLNGSKGQ